MPDQQLTLRLEGADGPLARKFRAFGRKAKLAADKMVGKKPMEGFVDRVLAGEIQGWAFDPNKPNRRVHITARCEGEIIAETLADLPRKDLTRGGKGDGKHGFTLRVPTGYLDGTPRRLRIEATVGRARVLLKRGEITLAASRPGASPRKPKPQPAAGAIGALESGEGGVLTGWAAQPKSGGAPAVVDIYDDERYLGSVTADRARPKREDEPKGAKAFQFRLPDGLDDAVIGRLRARITGTQVDLRPLRARGVGSAPALSQSQGPVGRAPSPAVAAPERRVALLVLGGEDEEAVRRTLRSWSGQAGAPVTIGRLSQGAASGEDEHVFGRGDPARLRKFLQDSHTVAFVHAGDRMRSGAARVLLQAQPLAEVLTWQEEGAPPRKGEGLPLAIRLGSGLGGGYAVRMRAALAEQIAAAALEGERALELALVRHTGGWKHLPAVLSTRADRAPTSHYTAVEPVRRPASLSLAISPGDPEALAATVRSAAAAARGLELELLVPSDVTDPLRSSVGSAVATRVNWRKVDGAVLDGDGVWLRRLTEAASSEAVVHCRAGVELDPDSNLAAMAAWSLEPEAGCVAGRLRRGDASEAGLGVRWTRQGWCVASHQSERDGPVAAASSDLFAISRAKLAAVGGVDAERFPGCLADFDLALRLRRLGWSSLALNSASASAPESDPVRGALPEFALFDAAELAAVAAAFPVEFPVA
jgi:hypothetical protein